MKSLCVTVNADHETAASQFISRRLRHSAACFVSRRVSRTLTLAESTECVTHYLNRGRGQLISDCL